MVTQSFKIALRKKQWLTVLQMYQQENIMIKELSIEDWEGLLYSITLHRSKPLFQRYLLDMKQLSFMSPKLVSSLTEAHYKFGNQEQAKQLAKSLTRLPQPTLDMMEAFITVGYFTEAESILKSFLESQSFPIHRLSNSLRTILEWHINTLQFSKAFSLSEIYLKHHVPDFCLMKLILTVMANMGRVSQINALAKQFPKLISPIQLLTAQLRAYEVKKNVSAANECLHQYLDQYPQQPLKSETLLFALNMNANEKNLEELNLLFEHWCRYRGSVDLRVELQLVLARSLTILPLRTLFSTISTFSEYQKCHILNDLLLSIANALRLSRLYNIGKRMNGLEKTQESWRQFVQPLVHFEPHLMIPNSIYAEVAQFIFQECSSRSFPIDALSNIVLQYARILCFVQSSSNVQKILETVRLNHISLTAEILATLCVASTSDLKILNSLLKALHAKMDLNAYELLVKHWFIYFDLKKNKPLPIIIVQLLRQMTQVISPSELDKYPCLYSCFGSIVNDISPNGCKKGFEKLKLASGLFSIIYSGSPVSTLSVYSSLSKSSPKKPVISKN